jgi:hypothetical protein
MRKKGSEKSMNHGPARGGFTLRGSWDENGSPDAPLTQFVKGMRGERKATTMTPAEFCDRIPVPFLPAFPNLTQWQECDGWHNARCSTSAESTIAFCFRSHSGEPCTEPDEAENPSTMTNLPHLSELERVSDRINLLCNRASLDHGYQPRRLQMHRLHGEMVARGATATEVLNAVRDALALTDQESALPDIPAAVSPAPASPDSDPSLDLLDQSLAWGSFA